MLLRSQTLLSSARTMNFSPAQPEQAADNLPFDLQISIFITIACLVIPLILIVNPFGSLKTCVSWTKMFLSRTCSSLAKVEDEESCSQTSAGGSRLQLPSVEVSHAPCGQASCSMSLPAEACASLGIMVVEGPVAPPSRNTLPLPAQCQSSVSAVPEQYQPPVFHRRAIIPEVSLNVFAATGTGQFGTLDEPEICSDAVQVLEWTSVSGSSRLERSFNAQSSACGDDATAVTQTGSFDNYFIQKNTSSAWNLRASPVALELNKRHERQRRIADATWSPELIFTADSQSALCNSSHRDLRSPVRAIVPPPFDSKLKYNGDQETPISNSTATAPVSTLRRASSPIMTSQPATRNSQTVFRRPSQPRAARMTNSQNVGPSSSDFVPGTLPVTSSILLCESASSSADRSLKHLPPAGEVLLRQREQRPKRSYHQAIEEVVSSGTEATGPGGAAARFNDV